LLNILYLVLRVVEGNMETANDAGRPIGTTPGSGHGTVSYSAHKT